MPDPLLTADVLLRESRAIEWLTVKEFAALVGMREHSVREAIRKHRLAYPVARITTGPKGAIRILVPRAA